MDKLLTLVEPHRKEHENCTFCPKLCRHSCPVSTVEGRETTTPWGKMNALHHADAGMLELTPELAATFYACTGCLRCTEYCDHGNRPYHALSAGRAEAMRAGVAPEAAREVVEQHAARKAKAAERAVRIFGPTAGSRVTETAFVPGCSACATRPDDAKAAHDVVESLLGEEVRVVTSGCCGLPLLDAGDREGFLTSLRQFIERIGGARRVVFQDPGCMYALAKQGPELGVETGLELIHLTELAAEHIERFDPIDGPPELRYHDPCRLGRGLGVYDAPRALLAKILGRDPSSFYHERNLAECSGAGGGLPHTSPETADRIADERLLEHEARGGGGLVTACPSSAHRLAKRGDDVEIFEISSLLARSLRS
jgi:dimethylglycine catabolism B